jgi:serine kinase of HPr protein (carbohydrate metabolism regulator)
MSDRPINLHGTVIRINELGILCVGASGSGKSELAFSLIAEAERWGADCALIADDQFFVRIDDKTIVAECPSSIEGLIELRGSGIISMKSEKSAQLTFAVTTELAAGNERLPPVGQTYSLFGPHVLPLIRIPPHSLTPYAKFSALVHHLCSRGTLAF